MSRDDSFAKSGCAIRCGEVMANAPLCREHYRLTIAVPAFPTPGAGQFVHLAPERRGRERQVESGGPMLRRAFSVAAFRVTPTGPEIDVIYRVVGVGTRWMESLRAGDAVSVLGPQGNLFPIGKNPAGAWLVAGGVGLPPMLFLAEALRDAGKRVTAFCGAQTDDLLALTMDKTVAPSATAEQATACTVEFSKCGAHAIISTDDGALGFRGHVGQALTSYYNANPVPCDDVIVYTCGPERMMEFVASFCDARSILCYVCMERAMACGTGMCQSCVVPIRDGDDPQGWRYQLCCTDGPVFLAADVLWKQSP